MPHNKYAYKEILIYTSAMTKSDLTGGFGHR